MGDDRSGWRDEDGQPREGRNLNGRPLNGRPAEDDLAGGDGVDLAAKRTADDRQTRGDLGIDEDGRLPWLETAEEYPEERSSNAGRMAALLLGGLIAIAAVVGSIFWLQSRGGIAPQSGSGEMIAASEGDYKVRPEDPMGREFEGEGDVAFNASEGRDADAPAAGMASLDPSGAATSPLRDGGLTAGMERSGDVGADKPATQVAIARPSATRTSAPPAARPAAAPAIPAAAPVQGPSAAFVQLGAYSDSAKADAGWATLSRQFTWLGGYGKNIVQATVDGRTVYRLRAGAPSADEAARLCARIKAAGASCMIAR